ncbi:MAG TPA: hypothetical protein DEQ02_07835 [Ruminococcaceae bacterium]|nr:hypothetical protein [Oscillospiraceae bacterium]
MKRLIGCLRMDMRRAYLCPPFWISAVGVCLILFISIIQELQLPGDRDVLYYSWVTEQYDFSMLFPLFAAVPFSISFCTDWNNQFIRPSCIRSNVKIYGLSKALTAGIAGGSAVVLGNILLIIGLCFRFPLMDKSLPTYQNFGDVPPFGALLNGNHIILYFLFKLLVQFFACAFYAMLAFFISTYIINPFVTLAVPILFYYLLLNVQYIIHMPTIVDPFVVFSGRIDMKSPTLSLLYMILYLGIFCMAICFLSVKRIQKRLGNG